MKAKIVLVNYSDKNYTKAQKINSKSALKFGEFDSIISYSPEDIDSFFYNKNKHILDQKKGGGYWLWKPYFIKKTLERLEWGEYMFYCDSGSRFIGSIHSVFSSINLNQDLISFELQSIEKKWTKRDCFLLMECDKTNFFETKQRLAGFSLWKKTDFSMRFVDEWLSYAQDERILTDIENRLGLPNLDGFVDHRHDQSIFSLLTKKYNLKAFRDPSQFGNNYISLYLDSTYPQIIVSTRQKNISLYELLKKKIRPYINPNLRKLYLKHVKKMFN